MNYEEKYNQTIESIKRIYNQADSYGKELMEKEFPELRESEDERIKNEIIAFVEQSIHRGGGTPIPQEQEDKWIAWLEKQCEKTIPKNIDDAALQYVDTCAVDGEITHDSITEPYWNHHSMMAAYKAGWLEKQGDQKLAESISQLTIQGKGFYKICPYCKERMVRDESKVYTSIPPQYEYKCPKCGTMEFDTVMYDNPEMEEQISADKVEPKFMPGECIRYRGENYKIKDIEKTKNGFIYNVSIIGKPSDPEEVVTAIGFAAEKDIVKIEQPYCSENVQKIRQEIERRIEMYKGLKPVGDQFYLGQISAAKGILQFIDSLPEENHFEDKSEMVSENLEEVADKYAENHGFRVPYDGSNKFYDDVDVKASKEGFIAGAEWQKKKDQETIELAEDHAMLAGMNRMKEEMMKDAVEYRAEENGLCPTTNTDLKFIPKVGDRVKLIIIKEN